MAIPPVQAQAPKKRIGCVGCGCAVLAAIVILLIILMGWGCYSLYTTTVSFTSTAGVPVPQFDGGDQVLTTVHQKLAAFQQASQASQPASLHLTADEINTLIARDPSYAKAKGHLFVTLKDNEATIQTSVPLSSMESVALTDRYLNGTLTFGLSFNSTDKSLNVDLRGLHLNDRDLSGSLNAGSSQSLNPLLNQKLQANPVIHEFLNHVQNLTIENSELVIETK